MERKRYNTRGKQSNAIGGYGHITPKGYRRIWCIEEKRFRMEHVIIWEKHYGKYDSRKFQIHHKDENKLNNRIGNLELLDTLTHKRLHSGCKLIKGIWHKPCRKCGEVKSINQYYKRIDGISSWCKQCCVKNAVENKRKRKLQHT